MEKSKNQKLLSRNTELEEILAVSGKNEMFESTYIDGSRAVVV